MRVPELSVVDLAALAAIRQLSTFAGTARGVPALIVVDDGSRADLAAGQQPFDLELGTLPAVLIGVGGEPSSGAGPWVDVLVNDLAAAHELAEHVTHRPLASTALALLLRHGSERSVTAGLVAESATYSMLQSGPELRSWLDARRRRARRTNPDDADDDGPPLIVDDDGVTTHLRLNRPHRHNALNTELNELLVDALTTALADEHRTVVISGAGRSFSSGGDLDEFGTATQPAAAHTVRLSRCAGHLIHLFANRVTVQLHGACVGAGIELPAFAANVHATGDCTITLPEVGFGLLPGAGGTVSLPRRIGRHRTAWLALTGQPINATTAIEWGLIDESTPPR